MSPVHFQFLGHTEQLPNGQWATTLIEIPHIVGVAPTARVSEARAMRLGIDYIERFVRRVLDDAKQGVSDRSCPF